MTLTEFLLARIAEDEEVARGCVDGWTGPEAMGAFEGSDTVLVDPARVLAECEAKRRIVEVLTHVAAQCPAEEWNPSDTALIEVLGVMADVYADHPDYREEWKP